MAKLTIYGDPVPAETMAELLTEFTPEQLTADFLEAYFYYEYQDNRPND